MGIYNDSFFADLSPEIGKKERMVGSIFLAQKFDEKQRKQICANRKDLYENFFNVSLEKLFGHYFLFIYYLSHEFLVYGKTMMDYYNNI